MVVLTVDNYCRDLGNVHNMSESIQTAPLISEFTYFSVYPLLTQVFSWAQTDFIITLEKQ